MALENRIAKIEAVLGNWKESSELATITTTLEYLSQMLQNINPGLLEEKTTNLNEAIATLKKLLAQKDEEKLDINKEQVMIVFKF